MPLIACELPFGQDIRTLLGGVDVPHVDRWVLPKPFREPIEIDSVSAPHVPKCGKTPFDAHFNDRVIVLQNEEHDPTIRLWKVGRDVVDVSKDIVKVRTSRNDLDGFLRCNRAHNVNHLLPQLQSWKSLCAQPCVQRDDFRFRRAVRNRGLFLARPRDRNEGIRTDQCKNHPARRLTVSKVASEASVDVQCKLALIRRITNETQLRIILSAVHVRYEAVKPLIARDVPLSDLPGKCVNRPKAVRTLHPGREKAFKHNP